MKLIVCGKNDVAAGALEYALEQGDEVWVIATTGDDGCDGWQRSLKAAATRASVRFDQPRSINDPAFVERLAAFGAGALVSIQYDQILHENLIDGIGCPTLNLHFSLLPRHRGVAPIAWALLSGDEQAGATLHHLTVDIDAGDVIDQRRVPIRPDDSARDLYDRVATAASALFEASHPFPDALLRQRLEQSGEASYHRGDALDFSRRAVRWDDDAHALQRWLRAMIFPPMQLPETRRGDQRYQIARVGEKIGAAVDVPAGTVVDTSAEGVIVAATNGTVQIVELLDATDPEREPSSTLAELAAGDVFAPGDGD